MSQWIYQSLPQPSAEFESVARQHQAQLTKPAGSLGQLEELAIQLAALQRTNSPSVQRVAIRVFAADHGVVAEGVSAYPQQVTVEMIRNFAHGGAAISVMARELGADFRVVNVGTANPAPQHEVVLQYPVAAGTGNFSRTAAMNAEQLAQVLSVGSQVAEQAVAGDIELFIGGEMGIGNTSAAAALGCALLQESPQQLVGLGTGVDSAGLSRKIAAVQRGLNLHQAALDNPLEILRCLGGFEIAALVASYVRCAQLGVASLVDGFICSVAALLACRINPQLRNWLIFAHQSAEAGHSRVLEALDAKPLLQLGMRLGEGSGAAVALPLLRLACCLHNQMATFEGAGVSARETEGTDDQSVCATDALSRAGT